MFCIKKLGASTEKLRIFYHNQFENIYNSLVFSALSFTFAIERAYFITTLTILFNSVCNGF